MVIVVSVNGILRKFNNFKVLNKFIMKLLYIFEYITDALIINWKAKEYTKH